MNDCVEHFECDVNRAFFVALSMFSDDPGGEFFEESNCFGKASMNFESVSEGLVNVFEFYTSSRHRRAGHMRNMMETLTKLADGYNITLKLLVDDSEVTFDLFSMYERYGFQIVAGSKRDAERQPSMNT